MKAFKSPDSLPTPSDIHEHGSGAEDTDDMSSTSSDHTVRRCEKPSLKDRQREKETVSCDIGRAAKLCKLLIFLFFLKQII